MTLGTLALIIAVGLAGPLLAWSDKLRVPVVIGELAAGIAIGTTGLRWVDPRDPTWEFLANLGFALVMFVAGSRVPVRDPALRAGAKAAGVRLAVVVVLAGLLGYAVARGFGTGHALLYAVLFASSSAAVALPIAESLELGGPGWLAALPQIAVADTVCIVAIPLALDPAKAGHAALGALAVIGCGAVVFVGLWQAQKRGWWKKVHDKSDDRDFALELRISLLLLLLLAALATETRVSIMLAGFILGLALAGVGQPKRLARQLFGLTEGLFGPVFFVWLGATLNLRDLVAHPAMVVLGVVLGGAAILAHLGTAAGRTVGALVHGTAVSEPPVPQLRIRGKAVRGKSVRGKAVRGGKSGGVAKQGAREGGVSEPPVPQLRIRPEAGWSYAVLASAQLGVPVAAATLGEQLGVLAPGEAAALLLGALITIAAAAVAGRLARRAEGATAEVRG